MTTTTLTWGLRQLRDRLKAEADDAYAMARRLRVGENEDPPEDDPAKMYDLGMAEGRHSACRNDAEEITRLVDALERER